jgi:hypothetical protein
MIQEITNDIFDSFARSDLAHHAAGASAFGRFDVVQPSKSFESRVNNAQQL